MGLQVDLWATTRTRKAVMILYMPCQIARPSSERNSFLLCYNRGPVPWLLLPADRILRNPFDTARLSPVRSAISYTHALPARDLAQLTVHRSCPLSLIHRIASFLWRPRHPHRLAHDPPYTTYRVRVPSCPSMADIIQRPNMRPGAARPEGDAATWARMRRDEAMAPASNARGDGSLGYWDCRYGCARLSLCVRCLSASAGRGGLGPYLRGRAGNGVGGRGGCHAE